MYVMGENRINEAIRRRIEEEMRASKLYYNGRLPEFEFWDSLLDLKALVSYDLRCRNAREDFHQHLVMNPNDFHRYEQHQDCWIYEDERLNLLKGPDDSYIKFLEHMVAPITRGNAAEIEALVRIITGAMHNAGYEMRRVGDISGLPVYRVFELTHKEKLSVLAHPIMRVEAEFGGERKAPGVFISYSWDSDAHKAWVERLAKGLVSNGVHVMLDQWDLRCGQQLSHFMEKALEKADFVLCILTPNYKEKVEMRAGGVGYEYSMISAEMLKSSDTERFLPLIRKGNSLEAVPACLCGRVYLDFSDDKSYDEKFEKLLKVVCSQPECRKPELGVVPNFG